MIFSCFFFFDYGDRYAGYFTVTVAQASFCAAK